MEWLNVSMVGLTGKCHPIMDNITTAREVQKLRPAIKMLSGDYYTFETKSKQVSGTSSHCRTCNHPVENLVHILCVCESYSEPRQRVLDQLALLLGEQTQGDSSSKALDSDSLKNLFSDARLLCQFVLDCTSLNLTNTYRFSTSDPKIPDIFRLSRDLCYTVHTTRMKMLRDMKK